MKAILSALATSLALVGAGPALAAPGDRIGSAVKVVDVVTATLARDTRTLALNDVVRQNEIIEVANSGASELKLNDNTKLALGPGSKLLLDKFVYDPDRKGNAIFVNLAKGAFRFMTGIAAKPSYVVRVPSASITVRGTIFDIFVHDSGQTWVLLHEGGIRACNDRGKCRDHDEPGKILVINADGEFSELVRWTGIQDQLGIAFDTAFPFVGSPPSIDPNPVFTKAALLSGPSQKPKKLRRARDDDDEPQPKVKRTELTDGPVKPKRTAALSDDDRERVGSKARILVSEIIDRIRDRVHERRDSDDESGSSLSREGVFTGHSFPVMRPPPMRDARPMSR